MRFDLGTRGRRLIAAIVVGLSAVAITGPAVADEVIDLTIDFAKVYKADDQVGTIIIGNPGIADATVGDEQTLVLTGKAAGTTNLIVFDKKGEELVNATLRVSSDVRQLTTVFFGASRQTFSCAPVCEHVISVGDNRQKFEDATSQIQTRQAFSQNQ
jgi:Flp pilus assembly secretin CpaC